MIVNTGGLTSAQSRLAIEYLGAGAEEETANEVLAWARRRLQAAAGCAFAATDRREDAEAAFKTAVPDWAARVAEREGSD